MNVKKQAQEKLRDTPFRVSDQFPKTNKERRRSLIPHLIKAKQDGKRAVLNYDKLYVNGWASDVALSNIHERSSLTPRFLLYKNTNVSIKTP